jgi:hypothetical protein
MGWTVLGLTAGRSKKFCLVHNRPFLLWGPPSLILIPGFLPGLKRPGRETDHSPASNAEVKNEWNYTAASLLGFLVWTRATLPFLPSCVTFHSHKLSWHLHWPGLAKEVKWPPAGWKTQVWLPTRAENFLLYCHVQSRVCTPFCIATRGWQSGGSSTGVWN